MFCNLSIYGQSDSLKTNIKVVDTLVTKSKDVSFSELDYYKILVEKLQSDNNALISLIQWTLGISLVFLIAIIGSQIFFNYRINKKEVDFIKKDFNEKIAELQNSINSDIDSKIDEIRKSTNDNKLETSIELKKLLADKFKSFKENLILRLENNKASSEQEIKSILKEIEKNEGDIWKLKGVGTNALSSYIKSAFLQLELKTDLHYILNEINEVLGGLEEIENVNYNNLTELSEKTLKLYKVKTEKMISLYRDKPVYELVLDTGSLGGIGPTSVFSFRRRYVKNKK